MDESRIILAADGLDLDSCLKLVSKIGGRLYAVKIHDLFDRHGANAIHALIDASECRIWVDAKLHDIPKTVELRARAIAESGADIVTVHASGEVEMMMAAVAAGPTGVYAITVLTSLSEEQTHLLHGQPSKAEVLRLARLAKLAGVHGIVCSPQEVGILAQRPELQGLKYITPGVRSHGQASNDQKRIDTPTGAIASGATHLVIGRQITQAADPVEALRRIEEEISSLETNG